jgi:serine/threonine-protein kinase
VAADERLLDIAAALADGTTVDWEAAAQSIAGDDDRRVLAELRFIADMARTTRGDSSILTAAVPAPTAEREPDASGRHMVGEASWGPLKIIERVGRGTFGDIYRAWDSRLDREVALKILRRQERDDTAHLSSAIQEGRLLARVRHPNVVTVYGAERVAGQVGVWMEFVHGETLEQQLREQGPFDVDRAITIGIELAGALSTVHRAGLLHRDVKTHNVMCERSGRLVLTDFGAGCELEETPDDPVRELAGTPVCVAPEVLAGQPATPQSDVYSLAVLLYHLVTGTYPVRGRSLKDIREAHAHGARTPLAAARSDLPPAFVRIVDRALDPNPGERYDSPDALGSALAQLRAPDGAGRDDGRAADVAAPAAASRHSGTARRLSLAAGALTVLAGTIWLAVPSTSTHRGLEDTSGISANPELELVEIVMLTEHGRLEDAYERAVRIRSSHPRSPFAVSAAAYTLTYAGFLDAATQAVEAVLATDPEYIVNNGWWTPTALLYQGKSDRFLHALQNLDTTASRLYRGLAEAERGQRASAAAHLAGIEFNGTNVFNGLAHALHAALAGREEAAVAIVRSIAEQRRTAGDRDGEFTFKQAQILSVAGDAPSALATLNEAVAEGFICVSCFDSSSLLGPVRALPDYAALIQRAYARQIAFGRRFGISTSALAR